LDISIIEFLVYALVGYTGPVLLIISAFRETPVTKSQSIVRAMYLIISIVAVMILAGSGINIEMEDVTINSTLINVNTTETWTETVTESHGFSLNNSVWIPFHYMLAAVMLVYVILQFLILFTKVE